MATTTTSEAGRAVAANALANRQQIARESAESKRADTTTPLVGRAPLETLPEPTAPAAKPARPATLAEAAPWLLKPFAKADIEIKISATNREKTKGLASPYADMRVYFARLDKICGAENWSHAIVLSERGAVCALTIFGVTKSACGDYPTDRAEANVATSAEAQSFKRACAAFGLGRYLYTFGDTWAELTQDGKRFVDPARIVAQMYASLPRGEE